MSVIETPWSGLLEDFLSSAKTDLIIATPYFSYVVLCRVLDQSRRNIKIRILLGKVTAQTIAEGTTDPIALEEILRQTRNVECKCIEILHAKVLVADSFTARPRAIITSSNLTKDGLRSNIEFGILVEDSLAKEIAQKLTRYWNDSKAESLSREKLASIIKEASGIEKRTVQTRTFSSFGVYVPPKGKDIARIVIAERIVRHVVDELRQTCGELIRERGLETPVTQSLLRKVLSRDLSKNEFEEVLNTINYLTGALRVSNLQHLLENDIRKVNKSLRMLLDDSKPLSIRVDLALRGEHKLIGGAMGFISAMLFINDSRRYNIYNSRVLEGLRRVYGPSVAGAYDGETYESFNSLVMQFREQFGLRDVEADWVLFRLNVRR